MNLLCKKMIIALGLVVMPCALSANQSMQPMTMDQLSEEEQQQIQEAMFMRTLVNDVLVDLIVSSNMTVDWLLQNYIQESNKGLEKIMQLVQVHAKNRWGILLSSIANKLGIQNAQERDNFIQEVTLLLQQVIPSELEKWVYLSAQAGLVRRK